jgi:hypothetical protein
MNVWVSARDGPGKRRLKQGRSLSWRMLNTWYASRVLTRQAKSIDLSDDFCCYLAARLMALVIVSGQAMTKLVALLARGLLS